MALNETEISKNLTAIIEDASVLSDEDAIANAVGVLTAESRHKWATIRKVLLNDSQNLDVINMIDSALFVWIWLRHATLFSNLPLGCTARERH